MRYKFAVVVALGINAIYASSLMADYAYQFSSGGGIATVEQAYILTGQNCIFDGSYTDQLITEFSSHPDWGFSPAIYQNLEELPSRAFSTSSTVSLSVPQFSPSLGTLTKIQILPSTLGNLKWAYAWTIDSPVADGGGISGGTVKAKTLINMPGFSWTSPETTSQIAQNLGGAWGGDWGYEPNQPVDNGNLSWNLAGTDTDAGILASYIGNSIVPNCTVTFTGSMELNFADEGDVALAGLNGMDGGYVTVTYTYIIADGTTQTLSEAAFFTVSAVPEPSSLIYAALSLPLVFSTIRRNRKG